MTSRGRVIAALERRELDRLPTFEWRVSRPIIEAFAPGRDEVDFVESAVMRFGRDRAVVVNLHDVFSFPRDMMGLDKFLMAFILEPEQKRMARK